MKLSFFNHTSQQYYNYWGLIFCMLSVSINLQAQKIGTKLGTVESINDNSFSIMAVGSSNGLEYVYFTSPWMVDRQVKIPRENLNQAINSIRIVKTKFNEWNRAIQGKGFKGHRKDIPTHNTVYTREKPWKDWHPMAEELYYTYFVDLSGNTSVEVRMSLGNSSTFCFYLTSNGIDEFYRLLSNANSLFMQSDDMEFNNLLK